MSIISIAGVLSLGAPGGGGSSAGYRTMTIAHTMVAGSTKANFKVWLDVTHDDLKSVANGGFVANQNHIRLASDTAGTTLYDYDIEFWDPTTGRIKGWVLIASLSNSIDTVLYVAYNDNGVTTYQGNRASVWAGDTLRYHLGDGSTVSGVDVCGSGFDLSPTNSPTAVAGQLHGAVRLAASSSQELARGTDTIAQLGSSFSLSCWYKPASFGGYRTIMSNGDGSTRNFSFDTESGTGKPRLYFTQGTGNYKGFSATTALSTGVWAFVAATYDGTTQRMFINGVAAGTNAVTGSPDSPPIGAALRIGGLGGTSDYADGDVDECCIAKGVARDADWWLTEYRNQSSPATYVTIS